MEQEGLFEGASKAALEAALPAYLRGRRWFGGKARRIASVEIVEAMPLHGGASRAYVALAQVNYESGEAQKYVLPLAYSEGEDYGSASGAVVAEIVAADGKKVTVYDATYNADFTLGLLDAVREGKSFSSDAGEIAAWHTPVLAELDAGSHAELTPSVMGAEQSNTSIRYGDKLILKLFRRLEEGTSPELEFGRYLGQRHFANTPPLAGAIEYRVGEAEPLTLAILQGFALNQGDAWSYTLRSLEGYFERAAHEQTDPADLIRPNTHLLDLAAADMPERMSVLAGGYIDSARLLGKRTAEMHIALGAGADDDAAFAPEPYTQEYQDALYRAMHGLSEQAFGLLRGKMDDLPTTAKVEAEALLMKEQDVAARFEALRERRIQAERTRCHGDYHLGQVLYTGDDFMIIDFEGEPVRSLAERRQKHSPLKDVAGMLRSFHYAAFSGMFNHISRYEVSSNASLESWASIWQQWISAAYLGAYLDTVRDAPFMPKTRQDLQTVLDAHLLEKAVYELVYELNNRPDWVRIPLQGIMQLAG